jgi:hypothetical protein
LPRRGTLLGAASNTADIVGVGRALRRGEAKLTDQVGRQVGQ